jgi:mRNA-degrading endonuclease RelE of RelBE toxin-antitoxin system
MTDNSLMWTKPLTVVELTTFLRAAAKVWSDDERAEFVDFVAANPDSGDVIPETGGLRKVRWSRQGSGKRGGVRVIYYYYDMELPLYLITVYAKAAREDLTPEEKRTLSALAAELKRVARAGKE